MKCAECPDGATGSSCQMCLNGYFRQNKKCVKCKCQAETSFSGCTRRGRCRCLPRFAGRTCNKCADGFEHFPKCTPVNKNMECLCHPMTAWSVCPSRDHGRCHCKSTKYGGRYCNECAPGRVNFPQCEFEDSPLRNSDLEKDSNGQIVLQRSTRNLKRGNRQYYGYRGSRPNYYDLDQRLTDLETKHTELIYMWDDLQHHVAEKTRYLSQFLMDEEGMVPVFNQTLHELEKMVDDVDKNMCQKVKTWTYFEPEIEKLQIHASNTNSRSEDIADFKELKRQLEDVLRKDDLLLSNQTYEDLVDLYELSIVRFESIYGLIMDQGHDIICRSKRIYEIEDVVNFFYNETEFADILKTDYSKILPENFNCSNADELDVALKAFEEDREILNGIDTYEGDVSKMTKKNIYKMDKIDRFLEQYFEHDFNNLDERAMQLHCNHSEVQTQITDFSGQWLRSDKKMPRAIIHEFCSNSTNDCQTKYPADIQCENSDAMKSVFEMFEEFDQKLQEYEDAVAKSVQILTENGENIKKFAQEKRLDALLTDGNWKTPVWKNVAGSEVYKNYKTKFQRRVHDGIRSLEFIENAYFIYKNVSVFEEICANLTGDADLEKCNEKISTEILGRRRRQVDWTEVEVDFEASGDSDYDDEDDYGDKEDEVLDERVEPLGCDSMGFVEEELCKELEEVHDKSNLLNERDSLLDDELKELKEDYQNNLREWCKPPENKKLMDDLRELGVSDQDVIQECQEQNDTIYRQYEDFLLELEAELERENEEELEPENGGENPKSKEEEIIEAIMSIDVETPPEESVFDELKNEAENVVDTYAEQEISTLSQHLHGKKRGRREIDLCPQNLTLADFVDNKDDYECSLTNFDKEIEDQIQSQKKVSDKIKDELEEIDELLSEIKSFSSNAEEILKSLSRSGLPAQIVHPEEVKNGVSKIMELPNVVTESFKDSSIGLDIHFSMQTEPHYANLFYLGNEEDFKKDPTKRRKRRKRENKIKGDGIFVSLEGHNDDECAQDSDAWMLKVDIFTKEGDHLTLNAVIKDDQDGGRFINVRLLQRLNRFELLVRSTNIAKDSEMSTNKLVQCRDEDGAEDQSCSRDFKSLELGENSPRVLFSDQKPKMIMSERPKRLRTNAKKESDCLELENCKKIFWCLIDQLPELEERQDYIEENELRKIVSPPGLSYLHPPANLAGRAVGFVGLKINHNEALHPSYEPTADTKFNFIVKNDFIVPEEYKDSDARECTRYNAEGKISIDSAALGKQLNIFTDSFDKALADTQKCINDDVCESEDSAAVVFVSEMYDVDVSKDFNIFTFTAGTLAISNGEIVLNKSDGEREAKSLKNLESCRGKHCDIKMGITFGGINHGKKGSNKAYGRIFINDNKGQNLIGSFFKSLPLTEDSSQFWIETAGNALTFYGQEGHVVKHKIVANDNFNFRSDINEIINGECADCTTFDVTPFSPLNTIAGISNVTSTCEQIPSLDLHLDESSVFYQLKPDKEDNLTEIFKPELDRFGLMGHTHFNYSLNDLKARALGVRTQFTVHECAKSPKYQNILQYVVKFFDEDQEFDKVYRMDSFTDFDQIVEERPETVQIMIEDCKSVVIKLHCHQHRFPLKLGEENDLLIYYRKEGEYKEILEEYQYDEAMIFSSSGLEKPFTESCPKETRKDKEGASRCKKKCTEKRLQLGANNNSLTFSKLELFKPVVSDFKNTVNMLAYTNLQTCPTEEAENQLYYCQFPYRV
ncbi:Oidioi.mRNA.OKI2018_I69.chr1.g3059.t1.cds [Oikopleura dioica]|uniref:Oidioi.mRNA.OKI2018_I69.chr1.g3059.t1.cds n=1 Tax=Oikopleura dioica TaxID=34765 RepID=A0ABN7STL7_OIKDI|nr:Oidioi.mRNA.OKI2018_I69.chr1.g3059.t1.cds [Oikopleura dioica]